MYTRYRHLVIEDADDPPEDHEIREIERELGAKLPYDFKKFLEVGNGGRLSSYFIEVELPNGIEKLSFGDLLSTKNNGFTSEMNFKRHLDKESPWWIPEKVLLIARGANDDCLYLDLRAESQVIVRAFIHGLPEWTGLNTRDRLVTFADSFTEYVDKLKFDSVFYQKHLQKMIDQNEKKYILATIDYLDMAYPNWRDEFGLQDYDDGRPKQLKLWN